VSEPRISAFARLANGNVKPTRVIEGQITKLSRTMHGLQYDAAHDEIVVPVALAGAVLTLRGGANGSEPPIRVLQGPHTRITRPDTLYLDVKHDEIFVDSGDEKILVFKRDASGDVPPIRVIEGPQTRIANIYGIAVDPVHDLIFISNRVERAGKPDSIMVYNRTDAGDVPPRAVINGPHTGILRIRQIEVDAERGRVYVAVKNNQDIYKHDAAMPTPWDADKPGFIGVWDVTDNGDVPPRGVIKGPASKLVWPAGVAINPQDGEVYTIDSVSNALFMYTMPEFFTANGPATSSLRGSSTHAQ
jgi:DNA-binding beta-propeller fold protein YncE